MTFSSICAILVVIEGWPLGLAFSLKKLVGPENPTHTQGGFMEEIGLFLYVVAVLFGAEFADKTMIVTVFLSRKYKTMEVILGIVPACIVVSFIGVGLTHAVKGLVSPTTLDLVAGALFIALGIWSLHEMNDDEDPEFDKPWMKKLGPSMISFCAFGLAEMADRTQGATITLSSGKGSFLLYWSATSLGLMLANFAALVVMKQWGKNIPRRALMYVAAVLFFAFGVYTIPTALGFIKVVGIFSASLCVFLGAILWLAEGGDPEWSSKL